MSEGCGAANILYLTCPFDSSRYNSVYINYYYMNKNYHYSISDLFKYNITDINDIILYRNRIHCTPCRSIPTGTRPDDSAGINNVVYSTIP